MMIRPVRLRLSRTRGFNLQTHSRAVNGLPAVNCSRPGKFGNPFTIAQCREAGFQGDDATIAARCVEAFRVWIDTPYWESNWQGPESEQRRAAIFAGLSDLRGNNIACFCQLCAKHATTGKPLDEDCPDCAPCHTDPLGRIANRTIVCEEVTP